MMMRPRQPRHALAFRDEEVQTATSSSAIHAFSPRLPKRAVLCLVTLAIR